MIVCCDVDGGLNFDPETGEIKRPLVVRVTKFDEESAETFAKQMSAADDTGQPFIPIIIDSYGGDPYSLQAMRDVISSARATVATIVEGKAMSCGAILFSCGAEGYRFVGPNATIMIHDVTHGEEPYKKAEEVKADAKEIERLNNMFYHTLAQNCGKPADYFLNHVNKRHRADWYLTPEEAVKHNLANHVGIPRLVKTVTVTHDFQIEKPSTKKKSR